MRRAVDKNTNLKKNFMTTEFFDAEVYSDETSHQLTETERNFIELLLEEGVKEVRFNDLHILAKGEGSVITHLRSSLPMDI